MFHVILNPNSIEQLTIQIKNGIMIKTNVSIKGIEPAKLLLPESLNMYL